MKPRTILQKQVDAANTSLPTLSARQKTWAWEKCYQHKARRTKKDITCLSCGGVFSEKDFSLLRTAKECVCPHCGRKLVIEDTKKRKFKETVTWGLITVCRGFQVIRFSEMKVYSEVGKAAIPYSHEIVQRWINKDGKHVNRAVLQNGMFCFAGWSYGSGMEIRKDSYMYNLSPDAYYPVRRYLPILKRNGFKGDFYDIEPFDLFTAILSDNKAETLFKAGQTPILAHAIYQQRDLTPYWDALKICIRNHYRITHPIAWIDYIDLLKMFAKDLHNPKYVCPQNVTQEHDKLMDKKMKLESEKNTQKKIADSEPIYKKLKSRFFDMEFTDGTISISVLRSVMDFFKESEIMHHCVFSNRYYLKPDSLIMTARVSGERVETVEFSLQTLRVVQSRGRFNQLTEYHDRILQLVEKGIPLIRKRITA